MIHYIAQVLVFQLVFLIIYDLFLKKETFFKANRVYLLVTPLLAMVLPFVEIALFREAIPEEYLVQLPEVLIGNNIAATDTEETSAFGLFTIVGSIWVLGVLLSTYVFARKLYRIRTLKKKGMVKKHSHFNIITLPASENAFTFMKNVFIGEDLPEEQKSHIVLHEQVHVRERHTLDLLLFEGLRILLWFNPLIYVFQKRVALLQEYIADAFVANQEGKKAYYNNLLSQVFNTEKISFINTFFNNSLIKNRMVLLTICVQFRKGVSGLGWGYVL